MAQQEARKMINGEFEGKSLISIDQLTRGDIETVIYLAEKMQQARDAKNVPQVLSGMILKAVMFEDSSRTAGSFLSAATYLGADAMQPDLKSSSKNKEESDIETVRCYAGQSDLLLVRHKDEHFMDEVARTINIPFQNGGNGRADHPSQTMIDMYTFMQRYGTLDGLRLTIFGDVANNRPARSLLRGISKFKDNEVIIAAPEHDPMPESVIEEARSIAEHTGTKIRQVTDIRPLLKQPGIFYASRPRKEYAEGPAAIALMEAAYHQNGYNISHEAMVDAHPRADITAALPHNHEIADDFYTDERAFYFAMQDNGTAVRMSLLALQMAQKSLRWQAWSRPAPRQLEAI